METLEYKEPTKRQQALIQAVLTQIEKDFKDKDFEALDELLSCLLTKEENEKALLGYLSDNVSELMMEGKLIFKY